MATFPAYLKQDLTGFKRKPDDYVKRTDMEGGVAKQMPRSSKRLMQMPCMFWADTKADYVAFETWVKTFGWDWFDWTDPVSASVLQTRIPKGTFEATPINSALSRWKISLTLEFYQ